MHEGTVVILMSTGQAGTVTHVSGDSAAVLLRNLDIWSGPINQLRLPQSQEEMDMAPIDVERHEPKRKRKRETNDSQF